MSYPQRETVVLENNRLRLTLLPGGGHIAAVTLKSNGVNALWDPPWETIDPSRYDPSKHAEYGPRPEARLLSGIAGHNLCFDFSGPPSGEEAEAGLGVHGEAGVVDWQVSASEGELLARAELPVAGISFERRLRLAADSHVVVIRETAENLSAADRAVGWTEHCTIGPPFLEKGKTEFHVPATSSKVFESPFAPGHERLRPGAEFHWPMAPTSAGGFSDLRVMPDDEVSGAYTAHLLDPALEHAFFSAFNPDLKTAFGYVWKRSDFPWLGIWEENCYRAHPPWRGRTLTRGMEFGVSPFPESRRAMIERGSMFGEKGYRWIPARAKATVEYRLFIVETERAPETLQWEAGAITSEGLFTLAL